MIAMSGVKFLWLLAIVMFVSLAVTGAIRVFAFRAGLLDRPTSRSSHVAPTPRGGGMAFVITFLAAVSWLGLNHEVSLAIVLALLLGGAPVALIGFLDDRNSLPASLRFFVHIGAAVIVIACIGSAPLTFIARSGFAWHFVERILTIVAIVWMINLFNFMDGIDGIAGSQAVFVAGAGALICGIQFGDLGTALAFSCLASATVGFLVWNWPPAQIFMGDAGSGFLGFSLGVLGLFACQRSDVPLAVWVILNGVFLVDATVTLLRRIWRGEQWLEPHRLHAYQHLSRRWKGHLPVTLSVVAINVVWLLPWAWFAATHRGVGLQCVVAAILPITLIAFLCRAGAPETSNP